MKQAMDQLSALEMHGPLQAHRATPDVVLDTLDNRIGPQSSSESRSSTLSSTNSCRSDKQSTPSPQSSGHWKGHLKSASQGGYDVKKSMKASKNNNNSHYQVPTHRYQGMTAMAGKDFSSSAPAPPPHAYEHKPLKQSVRKTAL
uniref:Uncharacterized protein n=1 Tax=Ciona savignyi TaxID=51511 RepID=H2YF21_CIOSA